MFCEIAADYLAHIQNEIKESSFCRYRAIVQSHLLPFFGSRKIGEITTNAIDDFIADKRKQGKLNGSGGLSPKRINDILSVLKLIISYAENQGFQMQKIVLSHPKADKQHSEVLSCKEEEKTLSMQLMVFRLIYQYAISNGYCQSNPAKDIKAPLGKGKKKRTVPSSDAISIVKSSTDCTFGMFLYWVMYTGVRRGELLALRWEDVNFAEKTIYISKTVYYVSNVPHIKEPKTEAGVRFVPLLNALSEKINPKRSLSSFCSASAGFLF